MPIVSKELCLSYPHAKITDSDVNDSKTPRREQAKKSRLEHHPVVDHEDSRLRQATLHSGPAKELPQ